MPSLIRGIRGQHDKGAKSLHWKHSGANGHFPEHVEASTSGGSSDDIERVRPTTGDGFAWLQRSPPPAASRATMDTSKASSMTDKAIVGVLVGLITLLSLLFLFMVIPPIYLCLRRKIPVSKRRIKRRYETLEGWLISKRVRAHDERCEKVSKAFAVPPPGDARKNSNNRSSGNKSHGDDEVPKLAATSFDTAETAPVEMCASSSFPDDESNYAQDERRRNDDENMYAKENNNGIRPEKEATLACNTGAEDVTGPTSRKISENCDDEGKEVKYDYVIPNEESREDKECPICMESFGVDQIVSWSPNKACEHVFHHECIKEWLLRHSACPFCRITFLPVDVEENSTSSWSYRLGRQKLVKMSQQRYQRARSTYFCIECGLVTLQVPKSAKKKLSEDDCEGTDSMQNNLIRSMTCPCIRKADLIKKRGERLEGSCSGSSGSSCIVVEFAAAAGSVPGDLPDSAPPPLLRLTSTQSTMVTSPSLSPSTTVNTEAVNTATAAAAATTTASKEEPLEPPPIPEEVMDVEVVANFAVSQEIKCTQKPVSLLSS